MKQTTFIADGKTKIFHFTFPFFLKSDVIIQVDSQPATKCTLICIKNGLNPDTPFIGGELHFKKPPKMASVITVCRKLRLTRIVDYQPTAAYNPIAHNQEMNYMMEILKDMMARIDDFATKYAEIIDCNSLETISARIDTLTSAIENINEKIDRVNQ